jgi:hypothetical protein
VYIKLLQALITKGQQLSCPGSLRINIGKGQKLPNKKLKSVYNSTQTFLRLKQFRTDLASNMNNKNTAAKRLEASTEDILTSLKDVTGDNSEELIVFLNKLKEFLDRNRGKIQQALAELMAWDHQFYPWLETKTSSDDPRPCKALDKEKWIKFKNDLDKLNGL